MKLRGFTLIELIVVMGILAILATIIIIAVNPARQFAASRNAKRNSDVRALQMALDQYSSNNNGIVYASITTVPQNIGTSNLDLTSILVPNYLSAIPTDPSSGTATDTKYVVFKDASNRVSVVASLAELGRTIGFGSIPNTSAQFTAASSEYLTVADNASLSTGDVDYWMAGWFYFDSLTGIRPLIAKSNASNREYFLRYDNGSSRIRFEVSSAGSTYTTVNASSLGAPVINTWYFVLAWHDSVGNTINIKVNNGTTDSTSLSTGSFDGTAAFTLGRDLEGAVYHDGRMDNVAFGKSPVGGIAGVISTLNSSLYNGGSGKEYDQITPAERTAWGLVSWWNLDEDAGNRADDFGTNILTDVNTVTDAAGI